MKTLIVKPRDKEIELSIKFRRAVAEK